MAQRVTVELEDDLDGGPADETVRFGFGGTDYEIDLSKKNAAGSGGSWRPTSNMPASPDGDSAAGLRVPRRAVSAAVTSGHGRRTRASRSASAGASRRALSTSTKQLRPGRDAARITLGPSCLAALAPTVRAPSTVCR